jgi:hypothetical protein
MALAGSCLVGRLPRNSAPSSAPEAESRGARRWESVALDYEAPESLSVNAELRCINNINASTWIFNYRTFAWLGKVLCMNTATATDSRSSWSRILIIVGSIAMLVGAVDPMEGSLLILPGSGLVALGAFLGHTERRLIAYRVGVFILIVVGVGAMWGLSWVGGFGGKSGRSMWWGVLVLPYLIGWSMGIWGPKSPRWLLLLGIVVGLWYLTIMGIILRHPGGQHGAMSSLPGIVLGMVGVLTIGGCITALINRTFRRSDNSSANADSR